MARRSRPRRGRHSMQWRLAWGSGSVLRSAPSPCSWWCGYGSTTRDSPAGIASSTGWRATTAAGAPTDSLEPLTGRLQVETLFDVAGLHMLDDDADQRDGSGEQHTDGLADRPAHLDREVG